MRLLTDPQRTTERDVLLLTVLAALVLVWNLGAGSLASWDEACYAVVSKGIHRTGDWVVLRWFRDQLFFDKPPLYMWLTALFYKLFGVGEFATRLPSALAGAGLTGLTYLLGRRMFGREAGLAAAGILLTTTDFIRYARFGTLDTLQLFFFTAILLAYYGAAEKPSRWWWFWAASAGCFMTKGPLVAIPWAVAGLHFLAADRRWKSLASRPLWLGSLLFLLLVLPWHVGAYLADPDFFMREYFYKNYVTRRGAAIDGHTGNAFFYLRVLINKYQPWIFIAPVAIGAAVLRFKDRAARRADALLLIWTVFVFGFFTFSVKTKLNWYILPIHPALSLLSGIWLAAVFKRQVRWIVTVVLAALALHAASGSAFRGDYAEGIRRLAPVVQSRVPYQEPVRLYDYHEQPAALFYWDRPVLYVDSLEQLDEARRGAKRFWLVIPAKAFEPRVREFTRRGFHVVVRTETAGDKLYLLETRR